MDRPEKDQTSAPPLQNDENPFIVFRHFADQHLGALMKSFTSLPTALTSTGSDGRWNEYHSDRPRRRSRDVESWAAVDGPFCHEPAGRNATGDTCGSEGAEARMEDATSAPPRSPFQPVPLSINLLRLLLQPNDTFPGASAPSRCAGLADYLVASPYSPLHLAAEATSGSALNWKAAFEDLLDTEAGRPVESRTRSDHLHDWTWIFSMMRKVEEAAHPTMMLRDMLAKTRGREMRESEQDVEDWKQHEEQRGYGDDDIDEDDQNEDEDDGDDASTELDLYKDCLDMHSTPESAGQGPRPPRASPTDQAGIGLISTLTTMEKMTLPNGMVRTKMTLKKRFADGREHCSETVETTRGERAEQADARLDIKREVNMTPEQDSRGQESRTTRTSKGWFWS